MDLRLADGRTVTGYVDFVPPWVMQRAVGSWSPLWSIIQTAPSVVQDVLVPNKS